VLLDDRVESELTAVAEFAPLHNTPALAAYRTAKLAFPDTPHVAVFDTDFHSTIPEHAAAYAVPRPWRDRYGIRRYGFHGLSVQWATERAAEMLEHPADLRLVVCHLGGGCSVSAVRSGTSVDTSMGFSPLEGVPMVTRSGSVDPGAILHAMRAGGLDVDEVDSLLNTGAGVTALAGVEGGMQAIEAAAAAGHKDAGLAIDVFAYRIAGAIAAMAVATGGLDVIAFTAGIGEASSAIRSRVCGQLSFLGVELNPALNREAVGDTTISRAGSQVQVLVIRAREELVAARAARALLG
jgi:acetate kinase